jgi:uncharacterized RDD family membrane protein YckC
MFCPACGAKNPANTTVCVDCDRALPAHASSSATSGPPTSPAAAPGEPPRILRRARPLAPAPSLDAVPRAIPIATPVPAPSPAPSPAAPHGLSPAAPLVGTRARPSDAEPQAQRGGASTTRTASPTGRPTGSGASHDPHGPLEKAYGGAHGGSRAPTTPMALPPQVLPPATLTPQARPSPQAGDTRKKDESGDSSAFAPSAGMRVHAPLEERTPIARPRPRSPEAAGAQVSPSTTMKPPAAAPTNAPTNAPTDSPPGSVARGPSSGPRKTPSRVAGSSPQQQDPRLLPHKGRDAAVTTTPPVFDLPSSARQWCAAVVDGGLTTVVVGLLVRAALALVGIRPTLQGLIDVAHEAPVMLLSVALVACCGVVACALLSVVLKASLGQRVCRVRLVDAHGETPSRTRLIARAVLNAAASLFFLAGPAYALFLDRRRRSPGDVVAGTVAILRS